MYVHCTTPMYKKKFKKSGICNQIVVLWNQKGENGPTQKKRKREKGIACFEELDVTILLDGGSLTWSLKIQHGDLGWFIAQTLA